MTRAEARARFAELQGIHPELAGWRFEINRRLQTTLGRCDYRRRVIEIAEWVWTEGHADRVENTLLHELAHALVGPGRGHGRVWQSMARRVGARPERCARIPRSATAARPWRYEVHCARCGPLEEGGRMRPFPRGATYRHRGCGGEVELHEAGQAPRPEPEATPALEGIQFTMFNQEAA